MKRMEANVSIERQKDLTEAVLKLDEVGLARAIKQGAKLDGDTFGRTALMHYAHHGNVDAVKLLLKAGAHPDILDADEFSAVDLAVELMHAGVLTALIEAGADLEHPAWIRRPLVQAARNGDIHCLRLLIDAGVSLEVEGGDYGYALANACMARSHECVEALMAAGADPCKAMLDGDSVAMLVSCVGGEACLSLLIAAGVDVDQANYRGITAAIYAAHRGAVECLRVLIQTGANLGIRDKDGRDARNVAMDQKFLTVVSVIDAALLAAREREELGHVSAMAKKDAVRPRI